MEHEPTALEALSDAMDEHDSGGAATRPTSLRISAPLLRAAMLAAEIGMDKNLTAATEAALHERITSFIRHRGLAEHFTEFPEDLPTLAGVAKGRIRGTGHEAEQHPDVIDRVAAHVEQQVPRWAFDGSLDATVERVLDITEAVLATTSEGRPEGRPEDHLEATA